MPASAHGQYVALNQVFGNAWRVSNATSLFDYARGTSTATFTLAGWPPENPPCNPPKSPPADKPIDEVTAQALCAPIVFADLRRNCVFDVALTGQAGFAKTYIASQTLRLRGTRTTVTDDRDPTAAGKPVTFAATVSRLALDGDGFPQGSVQFLLDGRLAGKPVALHGPGPALWTTTALSPGKHSVSARFVPAPGSQFLGSTSAGEDHTVLATDGAPVTKATLAGTIANGRYRGSATVTLTASAPSGIAATWYSLDGRPTATYKSPLKVSGAGKHVLLYASVSNSGIAETVHTLAFQIS